MTLQGRGTSPSASGAWRWFEQAAAGGSAAASYNMGILTELGVGRATSPERAAAYYRIASEQGHALAQYRLATLLEGGHGVAADPAESKRLFEVAAVGGNRDAIARLRELDTIRKGDAAAAAALLAEEHCTSCSGAERAMAARGYGDLVRLSNAGDASAQYLLGVRLLNGDGAVQDPASAARLFSRSARAGYAPAARQLAQMHLATRYAAGGR